MQQFAEALIGVFNTMTKIGLHKAMTDFSKQYPTIWPIARAANKLKQVLFDELEGNQSSLGQLASAASAATEAGWFKSMRTSSADLHTMKSFALNLAGALTGINASGLPIAMSQSETHLAGGTQAFKVIGEAFQGLIDLSNVIQGGGGVTLAGIIDTVGDFVELKNKEIVVAASDKIVIELNAHFSIDADKLAWSLPSDKTKGKTTTIALGAGENKPGWVQ